MVFEPWTSRMTEMYTDLLLQLPPFDSLQMETFIRSGIPEYFPHSALSVNVINAKHEISVANNA